MMLPLIKNSYNLVSFHQNLMKLVLNFKNESLPFFPRKHYPNFFILLEKSYFSALVDLKNFSPDTLGVYL